MEHGERDPKGIQVEYAVCNSSGYNPLFYIPPKRIVECSSCGHKCVFHPNDEDSIGTQIDIAYLRKIFKKCNLKQENE